MVIISKSIIYRFCESHTIAIDSLNEWYVKCKAADWNNFAELKNDFNSADFVGNDRYVFNIKGNRYRLVAMIHFSIRTIYNRFIGTHADYDKIDCSII